MKPPAALLSLALLAGCGTAQAGTATVTTVPPDLAGHQYDQPDADRVVVAGDTLVLDLPTGPLTVTVNGPALVKVPTLVPTRGLEHYLATFTITSSAPVSPTAFRLLAIADQVDGGARRTVAATVTKVLSSTVLTWTAPFVEGHGELLFTPVGATRPAALWDFRAES